MHISAVNSKLEWRASFFVTHFDVDSRLSEQKAGEVLVAHESRRVKRRAPLEVLLVHVSATFKVALQELLVLVHYSSMKRSCVHMPIKRVPLFLLELLFCCS